MLSLTPNEATVVSALLAAGISAAVSVVTTRYIVKHSANYGDQINDIHKTLGTLAQTQDELRQQQATAFEAEEKRRSADDARAEAAQWKPRSWIVSTIGGDRQVNTLQIESPQSFSITEACLLSESGANLHSYPVTGPKVFSNGLSVPITHESLLLIANNSDSFFRNETFQGRIRFTVVREGKVHGTYTGEVPFHAESVYVASGRWLKLKG